MISSDLAARARHDGDGRSRRRASPGPASMTSAHEKLSAHPGGWILLMDVSASYMSDNAPLNFP